MCTWQSNPARLSGSGEEKSMLFRILDKNDFRALVDLFLESHEVIGPRLVATGNDCTPLHNYLPVKNFEEIDLGYETTLTPAKTYFLPFLENLSTWRFSGEDWTQEISYRIHPRAFIGLHACD